MHTIIELFRVKMTEALPITTHGHREACLASAHNNVFLLDAEDITIDLLTDSGTGAMSARQWAALILVGESYAGSTSWHRFENTVRCRCTRAWPPNVFWPPRACSQARSSPTTVISIPPAPISNIPARKPWIC